MSSACSMKAKERRVKVSLLWGNAAVRYSLLRLLVESESTFIRNTGIIHTEVVIMALERDTNVAINRSHPIRNPSRFQVLSNSPRRGLRNLQSTEPRSPHRPHYLWSSCFCSLRLHPLVPNHLSGPQA